MASIYSTRAVTDRNDYVTTKTASLDDPGRFAIETTTSGITCNALCPGTLPTPAIQEKCIDRAGEGRTIDEATRDYLAARQPSGAICLRWKASVRWLSFSAAWRAGHTGATLRSMEAGPSA